MRQKLFVLAAVLSMGFIATVAGALWSASGAGTGTVSASSALDVTVNASISTGDLFPGFLDGDVAFTLTNPNPYSVTFTTMTVGTVVSSDPTGCPASNVAVTGATGLNITVAAGATTSLLTIPDVASMLLLAPDGCQGASFDVPITLTGAQT